MANTNKAKLMIVAGDGLVLEFDVAAQEIGAAKEAENTAAVPQTSEAFSDINGSEARPTITITRERIQVALTKFGGAGNPSCHLDGTSGSFAFVASGPYSVPPGTYRHWVGGIMTVPYMHSDGTWHFDARLSSKVDYT